MTGAGQEWVPRRPGVACGWLPVVLLDVQIEAASKVAQRWERCCGRVCDVANEDSVAVFAAVRDEHGRLDVLHSNAGIFLGHGVVAMVRSTPSMSPPWQRTIDVNLTGAYLCSKCRAMPLQSMAVATSSSPRPSRAR